MAANKSAGRHHKPHHNSFGFEPTHVDHELGDSSHESSLAWEALDAGKWVTLRCEGCDAEVKVSLATG